MKVLVYANKEKDKNQEWINNLFDILTKNNVEFEEITLLDLDKKYIADAIFILGGDGTILSLNEFSSTNNIPIIGINAGKLGFLTEFEKYETELAVDLLLNKSLIEDKRFSMRVEINGKSVNALNDVVVQRLFSETHNNVIGVEVSINESPVESISGDGVIICTPTGSTAYSLSAGGAILAPGINAFSITPISAHSLSHRPIIFSADLPCSVQLNFGENATVLYDGKFLSYLKHGDTVTVTKNDKQTCFLRKPDSNFYKILRNKMSKDCVGGKNG